jgi:nitrate reductase gamma subunit
VFGFPTVTFGHASLMGHLIFHGLVGSSFLVTAGVLLALHRRLRDYGAAALQDFQEDLLPLFMLFAISVTGLLLTVSYTWLRGYVRTDNASWSLSRSRAATHRRDWWRSRCSLR